jgi:two-component system sensor histidine kinase RpfC
MRLFRRHSASRLARPPAYRRIADAIAHGRSCEPLEFEQIMLRFVVGVAFSLYVAGASLSGYLQPYMLNALTLLLIAALVFAFLVLLHLTLWPKRTHERHCISISGDALALAGFLHLGGEASALFSPIALWVTLGNGLRFGLPYMYGAMAAQNISFAVMALNTPFWREAWFFTGGVLVANIAIPIYVAKLISNLRQAMDDAKAANKAKSDFLSLISHELRTPLNAILGLAQLGKLTAKSVQEQNNAATTELAAGRLLRTVDSILNFQRIESGQSQIMELTFDPLKMLNEVNAIIEPLALQKNLSFHIRFLTPLPNSVTSGADHIQTIILNIVTNAIKYTKTGGVWLEIGVQGAGQDAVLRINIRDTGTGITQEAQSRIFDRFVRAVDHNTSEESGVGLGLTVCKSLVMLLRGTIGCESIPGKGSLFWVEIPVFAQSSADLQSSDAVKAFVGEHVVFLSTGENVSAIAKLAASLTGMRIVDLPTLQASGSAQEPAARQVIVVDELASSGEGAAAVHKAFNALPQPPIVIALSADMGAGEDNFPEATIFTDPRDMNALTDFVRTAVRWRKIISLDTVEESLRSAPPCRKLSILVADDNELNTDVTRRMLALDGHSSTVVTTGDAALNMLMHGSFDIALLDVNMPRLSGIEVCKIYRSNIGGNGAIPIFAVTADASDATREMCLQAGMNDVLTKPVSFERLREVLTAHGRDAEDSSAGQPALPEISKTETLSEVTSTPQALAEGVSPSSLSPPTSETDTPATVPEAEGPPVFAEGQIKQLLQVFGREVFEGQFLKSFKGDVLRNLELLRQAIAKQQPQTIRDALHAVKGSANTAGARRLSVKAAEFENSCLDAAPADMAEVLQQEYSDYVMKFTAFADRVCAALPELAASESSNNLPEMRPLTSTEPAVSHELSDLAASHFPDRVRKAN